MNSQMRMVVSLFCLLQPLCAAHAQAPGRLFFTPEQRRQLERPPQPAPVTPPAEERFRFDGMLWRDARVVSLWINRTATPPDGRYQPDPGTGRLIISTRDGKRASLGAGQHWPPTAEADAALELRHSTRPKVP